MTATANTRPPFYVGDYGGRIQLTIKDQDGALLPMTGTVSFIFDGCVSGTKTAVIQGTGIAYWVITQGFLAAAGPGKVRAQVNQSAASAVYKSNWVNFTVQT